MTFAFNWGNCLNEVIRAHCCSPGPRGVMSIEITVCVFGGVFVFVHLLWATVILAEMSMRFFWACVWACVCTCANWDACVPECAVIMQSVMFLLSLWSWSVAMWCGWYICANVWVCVWSSLALVRLEANAVLKSLQLFVLSLLRASWQRWHSQGRTTAYLCQGVTFLFSSTLLFIILAQLLSLCPILICCSLARSV